MNKKALMYFALAGGSFLPAWYIFDNAPEGWIKWSSLTLLFILGMIFSVKQADAMGKRKSKPEGGFIYSSPDNSFQVYMDMFQGKFYDLTTREELGTFEVHLHEYSEHAKGIDFHLIFHQPKSTDK